MQTAYNRHKDHDSVKHFDIQSSINQSKSAFMAMKEFRDGIANWAPVLDFAASRSEAYKLVGDFFTKTEDTLSYQDCLLCTKHTVSVANESVKRKWRTHRDAFTSCFDSKVGAVEHYGVISKVCGDVMVSQYEHPEKAGIRSCSYSCSNMVLHENSTRFELALPRFLAASADIQDSEKTHWHLECYKLLVENIDAITAKATDSLASLSAGLVKVAKGLVATSSQFAFNAADGVGKDFFSCVVGGIAVVCTQKVSNAFVSPDSSPYAGLPQFMHMVLGHAIVVLIDPEKGIAQPNLQTWLQALPVTAFSKYPVFLLKPGASLWTPFGWQPIVVGVPDYAFDVSGGKPNLPKDVPFATVTYAMTLAFDEKSYEEPPSVRLFVAGLVAARQPYTFKWFKETQAVFAWKAKIGAVAAAAGLGDE